MALILAIIAKVLAIEETDGISNLHGGCLRSTQGFLRDSGVSSEISHVSLETSPVSSDRDIIPSTVS